ncbi:MAG: STAS-like domain-containing protein [Methylobacter sp.]|nr:STAS-like domain-containing protein [Methylobacter sp.]
MNTTTTIIDIGQDFSRYPAGRYKTDGPFSGEIFRAQFLVPVLDNNEHAIIELDGTAGYGSSFLEEAFGGLVRLGYSSAQIKTAVTLHSEDPSLLEEIEEYILDAEQG